MKKYSIGKRLLFGTLASIALVGTTQAQLAFQDDFESGNLNNWTIHPGTPPSTGMDISTAQNHTPSGANSAHADIVSDKMYHSLGTEVTGTFKYSYWIFDAGGNRQMGDIRAYSGTYGTGLQNLIMAGRYNINFGTQTDPSFGEFQNEVADANKYQCRVLTGTTKGFGNLNIPRGANQWHKFEIERTPDNVVKIYVDGVLGRTITGAAVSSFDAVTMGSGGATTSTTAELSYWDDIRLVYNHPIITNQPTAQSVTVGNTVNLSVGVNGAEPLVYAWKRGANVLTDGTTVDGAVISGATTSALTISNAQLSDTGTYTVTITNSADTATSAGVLVTVNPVIFISQQPLSQIVNPGTNVAFTVAATGPGTFTYQWRKNGTNIIGAVGTQLDLSNVTTNDAASYTVVVSNGSDPDTTSNPAILTVNRPPTLTTPNQTVASGQMMAFTIGGTDDLSGKATPFMDFEAFNTGTRQVMFAYPGFSGSTSGNIDNASRTNWAYVTNSFPAGHAGKSVLSVSWDFTGAAAWPWIRLSTANGGVTNKQNTVISVTQSLRFRAYCDRTLAICLGLRESNPTQAIGGNGGTSGTVEFVGSFNNQPYPYSTNDTPILIPANTWTYMNFDIPRERVALFPGSGNGVLSSTTGKAVLEHLALVGAADTGAEGVGPYNLYLDNFMVMPTNPIMTFAIASAPAGAQIDETTGQISWMPPGDGINIFQVYATDHMGLSTTNSFTVTVGNVAPPTISISYSGNNAILNWTGTHTLQSATQVNGPYTDVAGPVTSGPHPVAATGQAQFFRLRN